MKIDVVKEMDRIEHEEFLDEYYPREEAKTTWKKDMNLYMVIGHHKDSNIGYLKERRNHDKQI